MGFMEKLARNLVQRVTGGSYTYIAPLPSVDERIVTDTGAYYSIAFLSCMLAKSKPFASLPVHVFQEDDDGSAKKVKHPLTRILSKRWNSFTTAYDGWNWLLMHTAVFGESYVRVAWNQRGEPKAFYPLDHKPTLLFDSATGCTYYEVTRKDNFTAAGRYPNYEIIVFKTPVSMDCCKSGASLARLAAENVGLSIDLERFYSRLLRNGSHFPGYLETDDDLKNEEKKAVAESLREVSGISNAGSIRIFDKGLKYKQNPMTMGDISLIDQQTWVLQQCCRIVGVPPSSVYENSRATYSNVSSMELQFAKTTLTNEAVSIEQSLQPVLDAMATRFPDCYVKFDLNGYMRGSYRDRIEGYRTGVYAGFYTRAEVRKWEELPPIDGLDEPLQPTAYWPVRDGMPVEAEGALRPIREDMEARVAARFAQNGCGEKQREFARTVLRPLESAYAMAGIEYDMELEIGRLSK